MKNPKVDIKNRVVCVYNGSLKMYDFVRITKKGNISKRGKLPSVISDNFNDAVDKAKANMNSPFKIKKTKFKSVKVDKKSCKTWNEYILKSWENVT